MEARKLKPSEKKKLAKCKEYEMWIKQNKEEATEREFVRRYDMFRKAVGKGAKSRSDDDQSSESSAEEPDNPNDYVYYNSCYRHSSDESESPEFEADSAEENPLDLLRK